VAVDDGMLPLVLVVFTLLMVADGNVVTIVWFNFEPLLLLFISLLFLGVMRL